MSDEKSPSFIEKGADAPTISGSFSSNVREDKDTGMIQDVEVTARNSLYAKAMRLASRFQVEVRGIERVPEEEQTENSLWNAGSMWFAANMVVSTFSLGTLGIGIFGMAFWDSVLTIIFFNLIGIIPVAFFSTFGPRFGLRQLILSRFWFGYHGVKVFAVLNIIACVGWSAVNTVVAAQLLHTVNNGGLPPWGGIIVVSFGTVAITFFGYKAVHIYEKWAWIPTFIIFLIVIARFKISGTFTFGTLQTGRIEAGNVLSFGAAVYGFATGWASYASDYVVYQQKQTSRVKIFMVIFAGLAFPLLFCEILGAACMTGTLTSTAYADSYAANGIGGLFYAILVPDSLHGFGQFCLVLMALSTIANNCPNMYSVALSAQTVDRNLAKIPRLIWTFIATGVFLAISIPAYYSFESFMDNFMNIIGYWLAIYEAIGLPEHFIFKRGFSGYNVDDYDTPSKLPVGLSACFAFCCGVAGAVVGMYQPWWTGPIAALIPGDVGFELAAGFAFVAYITLRPLELRYFGR
ncbi:permease for cytosine/purines, uracil, thiamine, allantoin-domain-containing protein [Lipomyces kononenkoae]|uniref:Permease for cytosine/purines, uracil, thiamine, allantoin-domain-containing protein n=1 Tax=Lipomyces kononenkoae TaxID=34357 RepID=A0ACC3TBE4_LIPKO